MEKPIVEIKPKKRRVVMWSYVENIDEEKGDIDFILPIKQNNILNKDEEIELTIRFNNATIKEFVCRITEIDEKSQKVYSKIISETKRLENKRTSIRIPVTLDISLIKTIDGITPNGDEIKGYTNDISINGISAFILDKNDIEKNDIIIIKINLENKQAQALGVVCNVEKKEKKLIRVSFISIDDISDALLARFIYSYQRTFGYINKGG